MNLMTISEVTKAFNVSTRTLRYYEQIGLLSSQRKEDYAYRVYDENAVRRIQYIIMLRKLRIPLKQIALILNEPEHVKIIEIFQENIKELNNEISALNTIRDVLRIFTERLKESTGRNIKLNLLEDADIIKVIEPLTLSKIKFKEEKSMGELNKANETLDKLKNVRVILLPPLYCSFLSFYR